MKKKIKENDYGIDLKRFSNHKAAFPWGYVIKILIGIGLIIFVYYLSKQMSEKGIPTKSNNFEIEIINP